MLAEGFGGEGFHQIVPRVMDKPATSSPPVARTIGGKAVVLGVLGVALAAASFALWWNISRARRSLEFWGKDSVRLIQHAKHVELLTLLSDASLNDADGEISTLKYGVQRLQITQRRDISHARGLIHARHSLTDDGSFEWQTVGISSQQKWTHAVQFVEGNSNVWILFDLPNRRLANYNAGREITVIPKISEGWQTFIDKQPAEAKN